MIVATALCPPAPLLVPGLADDLAGELRELVTASRAAIASLSDVDRIVVISTDASAGRGGSAVRRLSPGAIVSASAFTRSDHPALLPVSLASGTGPVSAPRPSTAHDVVRGDSQAPDAASAGRAARPAGSRLAAGTVVAAYLLREAGLTAPTWAVELPPPATAGGGSAIADAADAADVAALADHGAADADCAVGLLVMANGSAAHSEHAPGGDDPRSRGFDEDLVMAVSSGDPTLLAATCRRLAPLAVDLHDRTLPALAAWGALTAARGAASAAVLHYSAPLGIGYLVGTWRWAAT